MIKLDPAIDICIVSESFYPNLDGGAVCTRLLAEQLSEAGSHVLVVTRRNLPEYSSREKTGEVSTIRVGPDDRAGVFGRYMAMFTILAPIIRNRRNFELILVSNLRILGVPVVILAKLLGKKCIARTDSCGELSGAYVLSNMSPRSLKRYLVSAYFRLRNLVLRRSDAFVAISNDIASEYREQGIPDELIRIIPNGVNTRVFEPVDDARKDKLRLQLKLPSDRTIVVYSGRLTKEKGLLSLIRVWSKLTATLDRVHLVLVGSGHGMSLSCEGELRTFVKQHDLEDKVTFTGPVGNVAKYLQSADVFVFPSQTEALGLALIEAQSCGLPAVGSNVGGIPDVIDNGVSGILVEPNDDGQLHDALLRLLRNPAERTMMGGAGRRIAIRKFALEDIADQYQVLFGKLLNERHSHDSMSQEKYTN